jgi:hypothetical protein
LQLTVEGVGLTSAIWNLLMLAQLRKTRFPLWKYLNQPLFEKNSRTMLNPHRFWYFHRVQLLERCFVQGCAFKKHHRE